MSQIGIMQGRLLPPFEGRFQAFPADGWRTEFDHARDAGLDCIEWIYERPHEDRNPLASDAGIAEIRSLMDETGIAVRSVCADYYMEDMLIDPAGATRPHVVDHLRRLITQAAKLNAIYIVLPFVDASSLKTEAQRNGTADLLLKMAPYAEGAGVELHLETDLEPGVFRKLLDGIGAPFIRANFDIGNSAALGYDPAQEITALAPWLGSVHVKDRMLGGGTVALGTGNADLPTCFRMIREAGFGCHFVLQAARGEDGKEIELAAHNRAFVESQMAT